MEQAKTGLPKWKTLLKLLWSTLYISAFTFGGGFVIVTFMKRKFVDELHWIDEQEMLDLAALAQSSPGAIAVNAAILVGWQMCIRDRRKVRSRSTARKSGSAAPMTRSGTASQ